MDLKNVKQDLELSQVIVHGEENNYFLNGLSDGIPFIDPYLLNELSESILNNFNFESVDKIVCIEAMGIPIATLISNKTKIPLNIIRKKKYNINGEYEVIQNTTYKKNKKLYINGLKEGETIIIIDDVISSGGTLKPIIDVLEKEIKVNIKEVIILFEIMSDYVKPIKYSSLLKLKIKNNKVKIID